MPATTVTWHDVLEMPEDGNRYEAIGGELYVSPPPRISHQWVSERLGIALHHILVQPGHGFLFRAPLGVAFPDSDEGVQPDLVFVSRERAAIIAEDWIRGAPDLVVEILSPATARRDRTVKRHLYERHGVPEYWIADPDAKLVEVWRVAEGTTDAERFIEQLPVRLGNRTVGTIDLSTVFDWPPGR